MGITGLSEESSRGFSRAGLDTRGEVAAVGAQPPLRGL